MKAVTLFAILCLTVINQEVPAVHVAGSLRGIMSHQLSAQIRLADLTASENLYGLGAAENLDGEILILGGKGYWSRVSNGRIVTENASDAGAALLVYSEVNDWKSVPLPSSVDDMNALETWLNDLGAGREFPFRITGAFTSLQWHVISWDKADSVHTHAKHKTSGLHGTRQNTAHTNLLGFYSTRHKGIYTHHSTNVHLHALLSNQAVHVDGFTSGPEIRIHLPANLLN